MTSQTFTSLNFFVKIVLRITTLSNLLFLTLFSLQTEKCMMVLKITKNVKIVNYDSARDEIMVTTNRQNSFSHYRSVTGSSKKK